MTTDYRALCAELLQAWDDLPWEYDWKGNPVGPLAEIDDTPFDRARTALAQPEPVGMTHLAEDGLNALRNQVISSQADYDAIFAALNRLASLENARANTKVLTDDVRSYLIPVETTYGTPPANPDDEMTIRNVSLGYWTAGLGEPWPDDSESPNEAAHLARELREIADGCDIASGLGSAVPVLTRAADLLERLAQPTCLVLDPSPELVQQFQTALPTQPGQVIACDQELATPTDKEIGDWWDERCELTRLGKADDFWSFDVQRSDLHEIVRAALTRWGRPSIKPAPADELLAAYRAGAADSTPQPIPVSERLPGAEDCDAGEVLVVVPPHGDMGP